jgi:hypothetical protein
MARQGLNCTLSYSRAGSRRTYQVRVRSLTHGTQMVASESHARTQRAYYPHRAAPQRFGILVILKGWSERRDFMNWLGSYGEYVVDPDLSANVFPAMTVTVPSREFTGIGVPLEGYEWGDHVGSMLFEHQLVFESSVDPGQKTQPQTSRVDNKWSAFSRDEAIEYFYPFGTQLSGQDAPLGNYDKIVYPGDPGGFNNSWTGNDDQNSNPVPGPNGVAPTK